MLSLESPHRGDSNENIKYTIFNKIKKITLIIPNLQLWDFSQGLNNEFESAVVNEPSVFELLKFFCKCDLTELIVSFVKHLKLIFVISNTDISKDHFISKAIVLIHFLFSFKTHVVSNYCYLKVNFLGPENLH